MLKNSNKKSSSWPVLIFVKKLPNTVMWEGRKILYNMHCLMFKPQNEAAAPGLCYLPLGECKVMAPHSSTLAWKIPWMEEPGRLQFMGLQRVRHDWATSLSLFTFMHWRRKWQPTTVFLPGESQGRWSLVGCCLWGRSESDTTEAT